MELKDIKSGYAVNGIALLLAIEKELNKRERSRYMLWASHQVYEKDLKRMLAKGRINLPTKLRLEILLWKDEVAKHIYFE